jgi:MFS family permease
LAAGFLSLGMMSRVPGGGPPPRENHTSGGFASYRKALSDAPYMKFVVLASLSLCTMAWLGSAVVLYMRDILFLSPHHIMFITAAGCFGVYLTVRFWGRFADHSGSGRAMFKTLFAHALVALLFLLLPPEAKWSAYAIGPVVILATVFGSAFASVTQRALLHYVQETGKIGYTNFWMFGTSLALGITPIIVGFVVHCFGLDGFRFCFALSGVAGLLCALGNFLVVRDGSVSVKPSLAALMNPALPVRTLARIMWITVGKHESRHTENPERAVEK